MIAALLITAALAAPATLTDGKGHSPRPSLVEKSKRQEAVNAPVRLAQASLAADPNAPDHELSFIEQFFSFTLASQALPQVKDGMLLSHLMGYLLPCGGLWGPVVFIDGAEFTGDVVISYLGSGLLWFLAIAVAGTVTVGVGYLLFFILPYLQTTATLNAIDRGLKAKGVVGVTPGGKKPPPPNPGTTPGTPDTPPPSYAY